MTKEVKPWWEYVTIGSYNGYSHPDKNYVTPYIFKQSVEHGLPLLTGSAGGTWVDGYKKALKVIKAELKKLNGIPHLQNASTITYIWPQAVFEIGVQYDSVSGVQYDSVSFCSTDRKLFKALRALANKILKEEKPKPNGKVYALVPNGNGGLTSSSIGIGASPLVKENYTEEVVSGYKQLVKDLNSNTPRGSLSIMSGPPGTGKTYLIRSLLNDCPELKFLILPANMVSGMSGPTLLQALIKEATSVNDDHPFSSQDNTPKNKETPVVLIIEDADQCVSVRKADTVGSLSTLLNASDGLIGSCLNLRIICTTNAEVEDFDPAILRPGRLSVKLEVGLLGIDQANKIFKKIGGSGTPEWENKFISLAEVYAKARGEDSQLSTRLPQKAKIGFC